jgi:hypothetical protein|tara:strand:+ start:182 stop:451 length:270 start_codon:yes stop_codon:yes gene_type:complete
MEIINNNDNIFNYILGSDTDDNNFVTNVIALETKIRNNVSDTELSDITTNYRNFSHDLEWITDKYKELVIELVTENLINDKLLSFYEKS